MDDEVIAKECRGFLDLLKEHFEKEENLLIPNLKLKLTAEDFLKLIEKVHDMERSIRKSDLGELYEFDHRKIDYNIILFNHSIDSKENLCIHSLQKIRDQILRYIEFEEKLLFPAFSEYGENNKLVSLRNLINGHKRL